MSLWNPKKPLNQPPHFGRVGAREEVRRDDLQTLVKAAHTAAQYERFEKTKAIGIRAVVR